MIMLRLAYISRFMFHRRVGGKELPLLVTVFDTWLILMPEDQKSLALRTPVDDVVPPQLLVRQKLVLFGVGNLSFRRHFDNDLSSRLGCSKGNSFAQDVQLSVGNVAWIWIKLRHAVKTRGIPIPPIVFIHSN